MKRTIFTKEMVLIVMFILFQIIKVIMTNRLCEQFGKERVEIYLKEMIDYRILEFKQGYQELLPVVGNKQDCTITVKESRKVNGIGTNWRMAEVKPLYMIDGAFWGEQATLEGRNVVVISDRLAEELFNSKQVVGNSCIINNIPYQIVGVYKYQGKLEEKFFESGEENIYFPVSSSVGKQELISSLIIQPFQEKSIDEILTSLGISREDSVVYDGTDTVKKLQGLCDFSITLLAWIFVVSSIKQIGRSKIVWGKKRILYFCIVILLDILVLKCLVKNIYVPPKLFPDYNIFDINHYFDYFKENIRTHNKMRSFSYTYFEQTYWLYSKWSIILTILQGGESIWLSSRLLERLESVCDRLDL